MGHNITALVFKGYYHQDIALKYDLIGKSLGFNLTLFHIDHYYTAYWQFKFNKSNFLKTAKTDYIIFPTECVLVDLMREISGSHNVEFGIISTDYFGGMGNQFASVYKNDILIDESLITINQILKYLGVIKENTLDEFDTVGLDKIRSQPEYLEKYVDLCDQYHL